MSIKIFFDGGETNINILLSSAGKSIFIQGNLFTGKGCEVARAVRNPLPYCTIDASCRSCCVYLWAAAPINIRSTDNVEHVKQLQFHGAGYSPDVHPVLFGGRLVTGDERKLLSLPGLGIENPTETSSIGVSNTPILSDHMSSYRKSPD